MRNYVDDNKMIYNNPRKVQNKCYASVELTSKNIKTSGGFSLMNLKIVDAINNVLGKLCKQDEIKEKEYEVVKHVAANEYIKDRCINSYNEVKPLERKSQPPRYSDGNVYNDNARHISIYGDVNTTIHITGGVTCNGLYDLSIPFIGGGYSNSSSRSYSDYISDRNDRRDEIYRDSLQKFYRANTFNI